MNDMEARALKAQAWKHGADQVNINAGVTGH